MSALSRLRNLNASHNQISSFPSFVCQLATLDYLDLSHNKIELLPDSLESLKVVELNLNQNILTVLPTSLAQCSRLKVLRVEHNKLSLNGVPTALLTDSKISLLAMEGNDFSVKEIEEMEGYDKVSYNLFYFLFYLRCCLVFRKIYGGKKKTGLILDIYKYLLYLVNFCKYLWNLREI